MNEPDSDGVQKELPEFPGQSLRSGSPSLSPNQEATVTLPTGPDAPNALQSVPQVATSRWIGFADGFLCLMLLMLAFLVGSFAATNTDIWQNLAVGRLISKGEYKFGVDPFLWTTQNEQGEPAVYWANHSWLYGLANYLLLQNGSDAVLIIVKALMLVLTAWLLLQILPHGIPRWTSFLCVTLCVTAASQRWLLQPMVCSGVLLAFTMFCLYRGGVLGAIGEDREPSAGWLWALVPTFALWANLDVWFILGPLVVLLFAIGNCITWLFRAPVLGGGKTLPIVLVVSAAATLANPHHFRVWSVPPDLSFILASLSTRSGIALPESVIGVGKLMSAIGTQDPSMALGLATLSPEYFRRTALGWSISGASLYLLFLLGFASFVAVSFVPGKLEDSRLHAGRFLVWFVLGVCAASCMRFIPLFVIAAAPITTLNFVELQGTESPSRLGRLLRLVSVPMMLVLMLLAWPGWIGGAILSPDSNRRVAWTIHPDPSLVKLAETVRDQTSPVKAKNVFNLSADTAQLATWFAPGTKFGWDLRIGLMAPAFQDIFDAREQLVKDGKLNKSGSRFLESRSVTHVAITSSSGQAALRRWWNDPSEWQMVGGDARNLLFAWSRGAAKDGWSENAAVERFNREAFGPTLTAKLLPEEGVVGLKEPQPLWDEYLNGWPRESAGSLEANLYLTYYTFLANPARWFRSAHAGNFTGIGAGMASLTVGAPGVIISPAMAGAQLLAVAQTQQFREDGQPFLRAVDSGPPALPLLTVRAARRAVAETPKDHRAWLRLADAYLAISSQQEKYWADSGGRGESSFLANLRKLQIMTAVYQAVLLRPDDPEINFMVGDAYLQRHHLDTAYDFLSAAVTGLERLVTDADGVKAVEQRRKQLNALEKEVNTRLNRFELEASSAKPMDKIRLAYFAKPYRAAGKGGQDAIDPMGRGLAKLALEIINKTPADSLAKDDFVEKATMEIALYLEMGKTPEVDAVLPSLKDVLGDGYIDFAIYVAGAKGDYAAFDRLIQQRIEYLDEQNTKAREATLRTLPSIFMMSSLLGTPRAAVDAVSIGPLSAMGTNKGTRPGSYPEFALSLRGWSTTIEILSEFRTVRALCALERGDSDLALRLLVETLRGAGPYPFRNRVIVERYVDFLTRYR